jgi:putative inorganic carbon (hco3(-)) transporter
MRAMRDLFFIAFLAIFFLLGFRRPFLLIGVYSYIDIVTPQRLSYFLLNSIPISAIAFLLAVGAWALMDDKKDCRFSVRQGLFLVLMAYCAYTTATADFPLNAPTKWDWVWKTLIWAAFLPLVLRTKLRFEALILFMVLSASAIIINGGIKTAFAGGGYGVLNLMLDDNSGLYEGSTISTVAIAIIPLIWWLARHGTVFPTDDWKVKLFAPAYTLACMLIPIGTETRTGLMCILLLFGLFLLRSKKKFVYGPLLLVAGLCAIPFLPASFTERMSTIENSRNDESANTRVMVWMWTIDYVKQHPGGGGFDNYLGNSFTYFITEKMGEGEGARTRRSLITDKGRAYHSAYFEMLGEQGYFGFAIWLLLHIISLIRTEVIRRRYARDADPANAWISPLALALQQGHLVYLLGALFIGIAYQPFIFMMLALQIGLDTYLTRLRKAEARTPMFAGTLVGSGAGAAA